MSEPLENKRPWEDLARRIEAGERAAVRAFVAELDSIDTARVILQLRDDERADLLEMLRPEDAADVLEHIPEEVAGDALESIEPAQAARILEEMPSAEQADLLGELDAEEAETILAHMEPDDARDLRELAAYDEESAGGLMIREFAYVRSDCTVGEVVRFLRENDEDLPYYGQYVYVEDERERLVGALRLRDLLLARAEVLIDGLMNRDPLRVRVDAPLPELVHFFEQEHVYGVPVIDNAGVLVGLLRPDAAARGPGNARRRHGCRGR
jgi:magnesium transporter